MIYETYPWKVRLKNIKENIEKYNTEENFSSNDEKTYSSLEQDIFLSAFIIRKLIDCKSKVIDKLRDYSFQVDTYLPVKRVDFFHRWPEDKCFNLDSNASKQVNEKLICNSLIHSYIFWINHENKDGRMSGFFVSSDKDRNKILYYVDINDYLAFLDLAVNSSVNTQNIKFDENKNDFIFENS